jgi:extracellular factor (EF) 3-hydroxypalmitic acid methyl ester biosynthesis protein
MNSAEGKEALVIFQTRHGLEMRGSLLRVSKHQITFENYSPATVLRLSEVLDGFKILVGSQVIYSGQAVVTNLIHTGAAVVCEAKLQEAWLNTDLVFSGLSLAKLEVEFNGFFSDWQQHFRIDRDYRLFVTELHSFFHDLRLWLENVELNLRSLPSSDTHEHEREVVQALGPKANAVFARFVQRFEEIAGALDADAMPAHRAYICRHLHPLVLCSPWVYRTVTKPLGYAGDYEMVNMMFRDSFEGASLFAKIVNHCFLSQGAVVAHRNRIDYLVEKLTVENLRVARSGRGLRVLSVGCGPALEAQRFLTEGPVMNGVSFDLLDFNDETLDYARRALSAVCRQSALPSVTVRLVKKSVAAVMKESARASQASSVREYDLIYFAGIFDYLTDQVCRRLLDVTFNWLAPNGLLLATNVTPANPSRHGMEHLLDWNLIYRDATRMRSIRPSVGPDEVKIKSDLTGVNVWIEVRKPDHA